MIELPEKIKEEVTVLCFERSILVNFNDYIGCVEFIRPVFGKTTVRYFNLSYIDILHTALPLPSFLEAVIYSIQDRIDAAWAIYDRACAEWNEEHLK